MPELADIFHAFEQEYYQKYSTSMLPSHRKAICDIINCRTPALGGQAYECPDCSRLDYSYHSCNNRHCPKCQNDLVTDWIEEQKKLLLPVPYFFVTFTLPHELNSLAYAQQRIIYHILFLASSSALKQLARDARFLGAVIGMLGVLQSWTRDLSFHLHTHYIVPGGGISFDKNHWIFPKQNDFLIHVKPLSRLFRGKFKDLLKKTDFFDQVPPSVWSQDWVVHCQPAGSGIEVIKYIAPYMYRTALSNNRITKFKDRRVTFRYKDRDSHQWKHSTLDALDFMRRFLQHVLPRGFVKIRYFGFLAPNQRPLLKRIQSFFIKKSAPHKIPDIPAPKGFPLKKERRCRHCGAVLVLKELLPRIKREPP